MGIIDGLLDGLGELGPAALHLTVAGLAFAETALFVDLLVPGEVGMVLVGAAAHRADIPVPGLVAAGALGATLGDTASYAMGRAVAAGRLPGSRWVVQHAASSLERAEAYFDRHGSRAVFLGRWVGALRAVVPFAAGAARMPYRRFLIWNLAASITWVAAVVGAGWLLGEAIAGLVGDLSAVVSIVAVVALVGFAFWRRRHRAARSEPATGGAGTDPPAGRRRRRPRSDGSSRASTARSRRSS